MPENGGIGGSVAAAQCFRNRIGHAEGGRVDLEGHRLLAGLDQDGVGDIGGGDLVQAVTAVHDQGAPATEPLEGASHQFQLLLGIDAEHLILGAGRVGQRPEQIEDGTHPQFTAHRTGVPHGGVMTWSEEEADADRIDAVGHPFRGDADIHSQRFQHIGSA